LSDAELAHHLLRQDGWKLQIVKHRQRAFKITGSPGFWSAASFGLAAIGRLSKDCEYA
jgi:hypothetical protein